MAMLLALRPLVGRSLSRPLAAASVRSIHGPTKSEEYDDVAKYPPIRPFRNRDEKGEADLVETMKSLKTVEEKQWYLNKPKFYGWYSSVIGADRIRYGTLEFVQYVTNTTLVDGRLPDRYGSVVKSSDDASAKSVEEPIDVEARKIANELEPIIKAFLVINLSFGATRKVQTRKVLDIKNRAKRRS